MKKERSHVTNKDHHGICFVFKNKNFKVLFPMTIFFVVFYIIARSYVSFTSFHTYVVPDFKQVKVPKLQKTFHFRKPVSVLSTESPTYLDQENLPLFQSSTRGKSILSQSSGRGRLPFPQSPGQGKIPLSQSTSLRKVSSARAHHQGNADLLFRDPSDIYYEKASSDPEFWQAEPTPIHQAFEQHFAKTLESCDPRCNASEMWCSANTFDQWDAIQRQGDMPHTPFLARGQYVFDWEKTYLSYPPLTDLQSLPSLKLSKISAEHVFNGMINCSLNEVIRGRADLVDGYGKPRRRGNDEVRIWLSTSSEPVRRYATVGEVTDLGNGSYSFSVTCLWPGTSVLNVAVAYPREFIRVAVHQHYVGVTRFHVGLFQKGNLSEATVCHSTPNIPGRPCICNFTLFDLYCGRPRTQGLTCADLKNIRILFLSPPSDVTPAELTLVRNTPAPANLTTIHHKIQVVTTNRGKLPRLPPCSSTNINVTWSLKRPRGFWSPGSTWNSRLCQEVPLTRKRLTKCLRNKKVWIYGDSNGHRFYHVLRGILSCGDVLGTRSEYKWSNLAACENKDINVRISFTPHDNYTVLQTSRTPWFPYEGVARQIDSISSIGSHILIVHYFLHYVPGHYSVLYKRMVEFRDAVNRLFKRNPNVTVALRGPHISTFDWNINHAQGGDALAPHYLDIIREVFTDLYHKVIFLDGWDMTIGLENQKFHPVNAVPRHMLQTLFSFAPCP